MKVYARAKVNLALDVLGRLDNGYHELDMVMAPVSIYDEIDIEKADADSITCTGMELPENNTISKMLKVLRSKFQMASHYAISLKKNIPDQAGLAGGSADAAAVCKAIIEMEHLDVSQADMFELGKLVGADVPFCMHDDWARVRGIGEIIEPIHTHLKISVVLIKPEFGISTALSFSKWKAGKPYHPEVDLVQSAIEEENLDLLYQTMGNSLEPIAFEIEPALEEIKRDMQDAGLVRVLMSGSGSSLLGFSVDDYVLKHAYEELSKKYKDVRFVTIGG